VRVAWRGKGESRWRAGRWRLVARDCRWLAAALAVGLAAWLAAPAATVGAGNPRCFGAASRDPLHPCNNPALDDEVTPTPSQALLVPSAPCSPITASIPVCSFGAAQDKSTATIALLGDSHADHWRAALWTVTDALDWYGISVTHPSCPYTLAVLVASNPSQQTCVAWNQGVVQWFSQNPEISTVFVSDHPGAVERAPGQSETAALVAGITAAFAKLPATVKHIIVIRDDPFIEQSTLPCVQNAIAKHENAGTVCAFAKASAMHLDPDVLAAQRLHSPRVQIIDLTHYFCGIRLCYPVIGGVLVYKDDFDHLTDEYSMTLGPYLLRATRELTKSWH
jgi:hypothetical protein